MTKSIFKILLIMMVISSCEPVFAAPGDTTTIGPFNGFGNISTSNLKVKAARPNDTVRLAGAGGLTVTGTSGGSKTITLTAPVQSVFGRTGIVTAQSGDYTSAQVGAVAANSPITPATKTKITYDAKGLVTAGADATTADISDSADRRYVTDAQRTVIQNTSGTNTGDVTIGTANGLSLVGQAISLQAATDSVPGALTAADHTTFNGKQPAGNYITALTGDVTASGPGSAAATVAKVQGVTVDSATPSTGDLLRYDGSQWRHVALVSGDIPNNAANTTGSAALNVPYSGATGAVDLNAKNLTNVGMLSVGISSAPFAGKMRVDASAAGSLGGDLWITNSGANTIGSTARLSFGPDATSDPVPNAGIESVVTNTASYLSDLVFKLYDGSGYNEKLRLSNSGLLAAAGGITAGAPIRLKGYTVATLPAGTQGDTAYVTDAVAPTFLAVVVGGGAVVTPVFYNGSSWVSH